MMTIFHIKHWFTGIWATQLLLIFEWKQEYLGVLQMDSKSTVEQLSLVTYKAKHCI